MQSTSVLYDGRTVATPSERLFAERRRLAIQRIDRAAELYSIFSEGKVTAPQPVSQPESPKEWLMRQISIALPPVDEAKIAQVKASFDPAISVPKRPALYDVQIAVCEHFGVTICQLVSKSRMKHLAVPRHYALYLAYMLCARSMPDLGRRFGNRDHTSILHSVHKIRDLRETDAFVSSTVAALTSAVEARVK